MPPLKWRVRFGCDRKGTAFELIVEAATAGEAKRIAKRQAAQTSDQSFWTVVRLLKEPEHV